ncbi:WD40 repeat domain-containing protein [Candidatus Amoebophilus asiaticus]|nr:WD40 repeat domain-containing protein [Candidatus Amoebophilus asiaticus]
MKKVEVTKIAQLSGHGGAIYTLEQAGAPHLFYSGSSDNVVAEWNLKDLKVQKAVAKLPAKAFSLSYVPEKNLLLIGQSMGGIHIIDLEKKKEIKFLQLHGDTIFDIKYLRRLNYFFALSGDGSLSVWSIDDFSLIKQIKICNYKLRNIDFNATDTEFALGCGDGTIRIFDTDSLEEKKVLHGHMENYSVNAVKYHPNGLHLLSGSRDAHLKVWDIENDYEILQSIPGHHYAIYSIAFDSGNKHFATASRDRTIKIWDAAKFEILLRIDKEEYDGHVHSVNKILWNSFNKYLISTGDDKSIILWQVNFG